MSPSLPGSTISGSLTVLLGLITLSHVATYAHGTSIDCPNLSGNFSSQHVQIQQLGNNGDNTNRSYILTTRCEVKVKPSGWFQIRATVTRAEVPAFRLTRTRSVHKPHQTKRYASGIFHFTEDCIVPYSEKAVAYGYTRDFEDIGAADGNFASILAVVDFRVWLSMVTQDALMFRANEDGHYLETLHNASWEEGEHAPIWITTTQRLDQL